MDVGCGNTAQTVSRCGHYYLNAFFYESSNLLSSCFPFIPCGCGEKYEQREERFPTLTHRSTSLPVQAYSPSFEEILSEKDCEKRSNGT